MKFFFTGAESCGEIQNRGNLSLGGFLSGSPIPNALLNILFGDISLITIDRNKDYTLGIILTNELDNDTKDIELWFDSDSDNIIEMEFAAVELNEETGGSKSMESIVNPLALPVFADFQKAEGETNAVNVGDLKKGESRGFWLKRNLVDDIKLSCDQLNQNFVDETTLNIEETLKLQLKWVNLS